MRTVAEDIITEILGDMFNKSIMSNLVRPHYVERLVLRRLGSSWRHVGADWSGWDLEKSDTRARIEVKQSAKRQTWGNREGAKPTPGTFDIREREGYYADGGTRWVPTPGRPADLYIFAWHDGYDPEITVDHRDPQQWVFYLLPEHDLPRGRKTIALSSLLKRNPTRVSYEGLPEAVEELLSTLGVLKVELEGKPVPA